jgi:D-alanine--poly(phosphoribitol) ligase subunit 2
MTDTADAVMAIFRDELSIEVPGPQVDVIESGLLDSLGLVTLVVELEQQFDLSIPFETLDVDDFRTVGSIVDLIETQRRESAG